MTSVVKDLSGRFIGTVYGINTETRELEVYIPKLMPAIPEGRNPMTVPVNMGGKEVNITHNNSLKYLSTITVKSKDTDLEMPKIGSKVLIFFLEGSITAGYWDKWNPNSDYEIIEEEKYPFQHFLTVGNKTLEINASDNIILELPEGYSYIVNEDKENKQKIISLIKDTTMDTRVTLLENLLGNTRVEHTYTDDSGVAHSEIIESSGLFKTIDGLQSTIKNLQTTISGLETRIKTLENNNSR